MTEKSLQFNLFERSLHRINNTDRQCKTDNTKLSCWSKNQLSNELQKSNVFRIRYPKDSLIVTAHKTECQEQVAKLHFLEIF